MNLKRAVCVLMRHPSDGRVVSVSRKGNSSKWGLPGGKVEGRESSSHAAVREFHEETGLLVQESELEPVFCGRVNSFHVTTYLYLPRVYSPDLPFRAEPGTEVRFLSRAELSDPAVTPFPDYNARVFAALTALEAA